MKIIETVTSTSSICYVADLRLSGAIRGHRRLSGVAQGQIEGSFIRENAAQLNVVQSVCRKLPHQKKVTSTAFIFLKIIDI